MSKLFTYLPIVCFIIALFILEDSFFKWAILGVVAILSIFAKYKRVKMQQEEIEFDDRVNNNILKWSLRSMFLLNALLIAILFVSDKGILPMAVNTELIILYLVLTLFIPFYIVPTIIKHY